MFTRGKEESPKKSETKKRKSGEITTEDMLNDKEFVRFLDNQGKEINEDEPEEIQKVYQAFGRRSEVIKGIKDVYTKQIAADTKGSVKLDATALKSVDEFIETLVATDPEKVAEYAQILEDLAILPKKIEELEGQLKKYGNEEEGRGFAQAKSENKWRRRGVWEEFNDKTEALQQGNWLQRRRAAWRNFTGPISNEAMRVKKEYYTLKKDEIKVENLEVFKENLAGIREILFRNSELAQKINAQLEQRLAKVMEGLPKNEADMEKRMNIALNLADANAGEAHKASFTYGLEADNLKEMKDAIEQQVNELMKEAIIVELTKASPTLNTVYANILKAVQKRELKQKIAESLEPEIKMLSLMQDLEADGGFMASLTPGKKLIFKTLIKKLKKETGQYE